MAEVSLRGVSKTYKGSTAPAVDDVSLSIVDGEFLVLVGPSGCGKSTLLRMVAGLEALSSGEIAIGGRRVDGLDPAERDIAMVFQNYALYPHMTARDNMAYGLKNRGFGRAEIAARVEVAARILQIEPYLDRKPRQLSGGQRQRIAMGRAIVREPAAFLFDEPLSNLDAKLRVDMRGEIKSLQKALGVTSIYVTHDQVEAMTLADRVVVLNEGKVEQVGAPLDVYRRPASAFVAGFIGSPAMNLLQVTASDCAIHVGGQTLRGSGALPDGALTVGLRPEDLRLATFEGAARLEGLRVTLVEELGAERLVHMRLADTRLVASAPSGEPLGDTAAVYLDPRKLHFFATSGERI